MCDVCDNIRFMEEGERMSVLRAFQERKNGDYGILVGDHVKTTFETAPEKKESLWVKVTHIVKENTLIQGTIDNEPFFSDSVYQFGRTVLVHCSKITAHLRGENLL